MTKPPQPNDNMWTILEALNWTTAYFKSHQIDSPRISAELFLAHVLNIRRIDLYIRYDQPLYQKELDQFKGLIKRRVTREPAAYITGTREFWSLDLKVTPDTLIPRPETECLVETVIACLDDKAQLSGKKAQCRILDLGTGSGAIILALAKEKPGHLYFAMDCSLSALDIARQNAASNGLESAVAFFAGDWLSMLKEGVQFDMIVSNPPYIPTKTILTLQPEIVLFEPHAALDGGESGFDSLRQIAGHAPKYLKPGGYLVMEMGYDQRAGMQRIAEEVGLYSDVDFIKDYGGNDRVVKLTRK